jgi:hypothetical protein
VQGIVAVFWGHKTSNHILARVPALIRASETLLTISSIPSSGATDLLFPHVPIVPDGSPEDKKKQRNRAANRLFHSQ